MTWNVMIWMKPTAHSLSSGSNNNCPVVSVNNIYVEGNIHKGNFPNLAILHKSLKWEVHKRMLDERKSFEGSWWH